MDSGASTEMAMFPLGTVLVPGSLLPLQVFEPRYLAMLDRVLASEPPEFGVVLIERGNEVGGGDVRTDVGCVVRVVRAAPSGGGRWAVIARGHRRIRVERWLPDSPYPRAVVSPWPDLHTTDVDAAEPDARPELEARIRRALALCAELGEPVPPATIELAIDPEERTWQLVAIAPIGPADRQRLLAAPGRAARVALLAALVDDALELLVARVGASGDPRDV